MARRTKEEAGQTRLAIISAARAVFQEHGVARTTLQHIASAAGVSRGAIYWHFADKSALFHAMRDQVTLPLIDRGDFELLQQKSIPPLARIEAFIHTVVDAIAGSSAGHSTFEIMSFKCEYVGEIAPELDRMRGHHEALLGKLVQVYREARRDGSLRPGLDPELTALDTLVFVCGLIRLWLLDETGKLARERVREVVSAHVATRAAGDRQAAG